MQLTILWMTFDDGNGDGIIATVIGLVNGITYEFRISAVNAVSAGNTSNPVSATPATTSSSPSGLVAIASSSTAIDLTWLPPGDTGGATIDGYQIERQIGTGSFVITTANTGSTGTTYPDDLLSPGSTYTYRISAVSIAGAGDASGTTSAITFTLPGSPTNLATTRGNTEVSLVWGAPISDGGTPVSGYLVEYNDGSGSKQFVNSETASVTGSLAGSFTDTSVTVTGLTNGVQYLFEVLAVNSVGKGPSLSDTAIPATVPSIPTDFTAIRGNAQVTLEWLTPSGNGDPVFNSIVEIDDGDGWKKHPEIISGNGTTIDNLSNGKLFQFRVYAENLVGLSTASTPASATPATTPGIPTSVSAVAENKQVKLTWIAPADGGSIITSYTVEYDGGSGWTTFTGDTTVDDTTATVTGLTNGKDYEFRISAVNAAGPGITSGVVTGTPITVAASPFDLSATTSTSNSITLTWKAPLNSGGAGISGYVIDRSVADSEFTPLVSDTGDTTVTYSDTGLDSGVKYTYRVSVITVAGTSEPSGKSGATTLSIPSAPTNLVASPSDITITLSWTAPASDGGETIDDYVIESNHNDGGWNLVTDATDTNTNEIITGLNNGDNYEFRVHAVNSIGDSQLSTSASDIPFTLPGIPTDLVAQRGPADAKLTWTAPADNGRAITDYVVETSNDENGPWASYADGTSTDTSAIVLELVPGQTTWFRVSATNLAGTGDPSIPQFTTPATTPGVPTGLKATLNTASATDTATVFVEWSPPDTDGGAAITTYTLEVSTSIDFPCWIQNKLS